MCVLRWLRRDKCCEAKLTPTKTLEMHDIIQYYAQAERRGGGVRVLRGEQFKLSSMMPENASSNPAHFKNTVLLTLLSHEAPNELCPKLVNSRHWAGITKKS